MIMIRSGIWCNVPIHISGARKIIRWLGAGALHKAVNRFYCYLDKLSCTNTIKDMIVERFHLPRMQAILQTDLRYRTDPDELDRLFAQ
jgi:hypothetical protein